MKNKIADATNIGSQTPRNIALDLNKVFSSIEYAETTQKLQEKVQAMTRQPKIIRLCRCFCCEKSFSAKKMSICSVICKACFLTATAQDKGRIARNNFIEKTLNNLHKFLRRCIAL